MTLRILVVDDHALIREGLRPLLSRLGQGEPVEVVEAASHAEALARLAAGPGFDLALLDLRMPDVSGFAALVDLQEGHPDLPIVVVTGDDDPALVREAIERGALGYIPKSSPAAVILGALRLVLAGGTYVPPDIVTTSRPAASVPPPDPERLKSAAARLGITPRQMDVLTLLLAGKSNKVISRELNLAEGTVKNHVAAVLRAMGVDNRVQAVIAAARLGIK